MEKYVYLCECNVNTYACMCKRQEQNEKAIKTKYDKMIIKHFK